MKVTKSLDKVFLYLSSDSNYKSAIKRRMIKIVLSSSVIRVFKSGSKNELSKCLLKIDLNQLKNIKSQDQFDNWHSLNINNIYLSLRGEPENLERLGKEGLKWGHSAKIFNLFIGHIVMMSPYFTSQEIKDVKFYLHVPLDSKVFAQLKSCGVKSVPGKIKAVTENTYKVIQETIRNSASTYNLPPIYFDDYAWTLDKVS